MFKFLLNLSISLHALASNFGTQVVDIGFKGFDKHIAIELTTLSGEDALKFSLASNVSNKSADVSNCIYLQSSREREVDKIQDPLVRRDFMRWIFVRSDYSSTTIVQFYP